MLPDFKSKLPEISEMKSEQRKQMIKESIAGICGVITIIIIAILAYGFAG